MVELHAGADRWIAFARRVRSACAFGDRVKFGCLKAAGQVNDGASSFLMLEKAVRPPVLRSRAVASAPSERRAVTRPVLSTPDRVRVKSLDRDRARRGNHRLGLRRTRGSS